LSVESKTCQSKRLAAQPLIEAVEAPGCRWVLGVQWHPERMWRSAPAHRRLFAELVKAARHARVG